MAEKRFPCITYLRHRSGDRRASTFALDQQSDAEATLERLGYDIVGGFGDPEFAPPYQGWLEPRPGWIQAKEKATEIAQAGGSCALVILRADRIGSGDIFLPDEEEMRELGNVDVQICGFSLRSHADTTSLRSAHAYLSRYKQQERARDQLQAGVELGALAKGEIQLEPEYRKRSVRAFFCNPDVRPIELVWQTQSKPLRSEGEWRSAGEPWKLLIPPRSKQYLDTFFQDEPNPVATWWRFKRSNPLTNQTGNLIITPSDLTERELQVSWYDHLPQPLPETDFQWEGRPAIRTPRLRLRNWCSKDAPAYAQLCRSAGVMRFLGGVQSQNELLDDLNYFSELGKSGLTYWALERIEDGAILGFCGAIRVEEEDTPVRCEWEMGWRLGAAYWGQGYAYDAAVAVLHSLFEEWNFERVVCRIDSENRNSRKLAERLGFIDKPARRHEGDVDQLICVYEMTAEDYWRSGMTSAALEEG